MPPNPLSILLLASLLSIISSKTNHFLTSPIALAALSQQDSTTNLKNSADVLCKDVSMSNVTQDERKHADSIRQSVNKYRNGNPIVDFIEGPEPSDKFNNEYIVSLAKTAAPWFVLLGIASLTFLVLLVNCCWTFGNCCGSRPKRVLRTSKFKTCLIITSIITLIGLIGFSIYGIPVSSDFAKGGNQTMCQAGILVDQLVEGTNNHPWVGLRDLVNKLMITLNNFASTGINLNYPTAATDIALVNTKFTTNSPTVNSMYTNNKDSTVNRADPTIGGTYQPDYIKNLGPSSTATTQTGAILTEMQDKKDILTQASQDITTSIAQIKGGVVISIAILQQAEESAQNASYAINNMTDSIQTNGPSIQDSIRGFGKGLFAIFISKIIIGVGAIISIGLVAYGLMALNKVLHCSWCLISLFMITGWVLAAILFPVSVVLVESCEVGEKVITNETFFNKTFDKFLSGEDYEQAREMLYTCLYGDGDVLEALDIRSKLAPFESLFNALDDTANLTESIQPVPDSYEIPLQQWKVNQYQNGFKFDATESNSDLAKLSLYTNFNYNPCTQVYDDWFFNSANCSTFSTGTIFTSDSAPDFNLYSHTCIGFDAWGTKTVSQRYNTNSFPQPACGSIGGQTEDVALSNFVNNFVTSRKQVSTVFGNVKTSLGTVATANTDYMKAVKSATSNIAPVRDQSKVIYQALGDKDVGIFKNSDCRFVKESIANLRDVMCVRFVGGAYQTSIALSVVSFIAILGVSLMFCLAKRNSFVLDRNDGNEKEYFRVVQQD